MGTKERKTREQKIRSEDILDAAERVFFQKGFENSTVDDIAREAQYTKRTLYAYFSGKDQIYTAIVLRAYIILNEMMEEALRGCEAANGLAQMVEISRTYMNFIVLYIHYFKAMMFYQNWDKEMAKEDEVLAQCFLEGEKTFDLLVGLLKKGVADGSIREDLDITGTAFVLYAELLGFGNLMIYKSDYVMDHYRRPMADLLEEMIQFMIRGLTD